MAGSNNENNLVLLTAREHFICHWLLVKRYEKGSVERNKMLFAFHRMCFSDPNGSGEHKINSKVFERYRIEFYERISLYQKEHQKGKLNSQYGCSWYTNRNTGECKTFKEQPDVCWVKGRNLFNGQVCELFTSLDLKTKNTELETKIIWNKFHSSNCSSILEFCNKGLYTRSRISLIERFKKYIPIYTKLSSQGIIFQSNKNLIDVFQ